VLCSALEAIVRLALSMGGTATGEHGVGSLKTTSATRSWAPLARCTAVKHAFDPAGLMNPGTAI
jgi:glycolate dehydrogenase FAD-linked subunit